MAQFQGSTASRSGRGLAAGASQELCEEACTDLRNFSPIFHFFVWHLGSRPIRWLHAMVERVPARLIIQYVSFLLKFPLDSATLVPI